jgi:hypothetical protein
MSGDLPAAKVRSEFARERRRRALSRIAARLRMEPDDVSVMLPFDEVVSALGRRSQVDLGIQDIPVDSIVGTVDRRRREFDRAFRPVGPEARTRWERIAKARRSSQGLPPIEVYRVGELHFVRDGHHRVSVARAFGDEMIEAHVIEVRTAVPAGKELTTLDLPLKQHERVFHERVPLPRALRQEIQLTDEWRWARLADLVEAWGFRASHARGLLLSREDVALAWYREEYKPVVEMLREAGVGGPGTETERYLRLAMLRYLLLFTNDWSEDVVERLLGELRGDVRQTALAQDTLVHQILKEMDE